MYEAYFGFSQRPFAASPLANRYFPAASVDAARQMLARCIERGAGAGLLIGPPGMGKSLILQVLAGQFADRMAVVQLAGSRIESRRELLQAILFELQLPYRGLEEGELRLALVDHLTRGDKCPQGMLLLVDEAQTLPTLLLEELRMMTNLARGGETRVRLVLAGSMELEEVFASPDLQAFSQRLAARCYLEPFDRAETLDFLRFQVAVAGGQAERVFDAGALDAVYRATDGVPRIVNQVCDHALVLAYQAERRPVDAKTIEMAWADLQQLPSPWQHERAAEGEAREKRETIEFGALEDDEPAQVAQWPMAGAIHQAAAAWASGPSEERVEVDFSADWPGEEHDGTQNSPAHPAVAGRIADSIHGKGPPTSTKGLRIIEDLDKLQVVIDPYDMDDADEEEEADDEHGQAREADELTEMGPACALLDDARADIDAHGHELLNVWEDVIIPAEPTQRNPLRTMGSSLRELPFDSPSESPTMSPAPLQEEIVADRYAEIDARQRRLIGTPPKQPLAREFDERVTLAEAIRLRREAEAAATARVPAESPDEQLRLAIDNAPPLPSPQDWITDSATMVLDPTQLPPGVLLDAAAADLGGDIVILDDEAPAATPSANGPVHRVERKDYKSLFAQLRRG